MADQYGEEFMRFTETDFPGAFILDVELREDERGFFARTFCQEEFVANGLEPRVAQSNLVFSHRAGTIRGMHYQLPPAAEAKLVRCIRGAIWDVIIDLRPDSPTYGRHLGVELTEANRHALYVPELCAHGYQTLTDRAEVTYLVSESHQPDLERGIRYDDPYFGIAWPIPVTTISPKDSSWPAFRTQTFLNLEPRS
jgi:dTDP-4-dehydrorhamnose 3,5-epimerase